MTWHPKCPERTEGNDQGRDEHREYGQGMPFSGKVRGATSRVSSERGDKPPCGRPVLGYAGALKIRRAGH